MARMVSRFIKPDSDEQSMDVYEAVYKTAPI